MHYPKDKISAVILAGGKGRRLGGVDKGLLQKDGIPFVAHINNLIGPQVSKVLINANRNIDVYQKYGYVFQDRMDNYQGPLAGMHSAMQECSSDWILSVPCDGINLPQDMVARFYQDIKKSNQLIAVAFDGKRLQPVHAMIHCSLSNSLEYYLDSGGRKIDIWYAQHGYAKTDFSDVPEMFNNINTEEDKLRFETD